MIRHLFWDFDGTLYNSYPEVLRSFQKAMADFGLSTLVDPQEASRLLKISVFHAVSHYAALAQMDTEPLMQAFTGYHHNDLDFEGYPHLRLCLETLQRAGCSHYLYTHRDGLAVEKLKQDGLWPLFSDAVLRTAGFPDKPAPDALLSLMRRHNLAPETCAMIGDRPIDVQAGRNAGICGVLFDPDGYYADFPVERRYTDLLDLARAFSDR